MDSREEVLLEWLHGFEASISDIYDSVGMGNCLAKIDPFFDDIQHVVAKRNDMSSSEKASNWNIILLSVKTFFTRVLLKGFKVHDEVDTIAIAEDRSLDDIINLMELVVGASAMSSKSSHFKHLIFKLSHSSQLYIKELLENISINTYDLNCQENDMSNLSDDSYDSDTFSDFEEEKSPRDNLLKCYLETKATLTLQRVTALKDQEERIIMQRRVDSLSSINSLLEKNMSCKSTHQIRTEEKLDVALAANTTLQLEISKLADQLHEADICCSDLQKNMSDMKHEVEAAKGANSELDKALASVEMYKHRVDCLTPVLSINEHLEFSLHEAQSQLQEMELAVSTRIKMEEKIRDSDLDILQREHAKVKDDCLKQSQEIAMLKSTIETLQQELSAKALLLKDHEKLQDDFSVQCLQSLKLEQTIESHQIIFCQYKRLIKDTYRVINELQNGHKKAIPVKRKESAL